MIQVNICYSETDNLINTKIPIMPKIGESIGFWEDEDWIVAEISSIIYEFDEDNNFESIEINCH